MPWDLRLSGAVRGQETPADCEFLASLRNRAAMLRSWLWSIRARLSRAVASRRAIVWWLRAVPL